MKNIVRTVLTAMLLVSLSAISSNADSSDNFIADDVNEDGKVSQSEFSGPEGHFSQLDADGSGYIDSNEGPAGPPGADHASNDSGSGGPGGRGSGGDGPEGGGPGGGGPGGRG